VCNEYRIRGGRVVPSLRTQASAHLLATIDRHPTEHAHRAATSAAALDARELRAWRGMLRVHAAITKTLDAEMEARHGLPLSSYEVLMFLQDAEEQRMRMCDLATGVLLSRSGLTRLVDRLERDGLLVREQCAQDARGAFARLTDEGRARVTEARATHLAGVRALFCAPLSDAQLDALGDAWDAVLPSGGACCAPAAE
jgi:DNA-binding MarR family transcriptional regulator